MTRFCLLHAMHGHLPGLSAFMAFRIARAGVRPVMRAPCTVACSTNNVNSCSLTAVPTTYIMIRICCFSSKIESFSPSRSRDFSKVTRCRHRRFSFLSRSDVGITTARIWITEPPSHYDTRGSLPIFREVLLCYKMMLHNFVHSFFYFFI